VRFINVNLTTRLILGGAALHKGQALDKLRTGCDYDVVSILRRLGRSSKAQQLPTFRHRQIRPDHTDWPSGQPYRSSSGFRRSVGPPAAWPLWAIWLTRRWDAGHAALADF